MISDTEVIFRLILAVVLGALVGLEREVHGRAAGLRTNALVCMGASLIMMTSMYIYEFYKGTGAVDPSRIAAHVVSGIGFLGAGTILKFKATIRGLTTAAGLWIVAGVGLAIGCGFYTAAITTTALILMLLCLLRRLENGIVDRIKEY